MTAPIISENVLVKISNDVHKRFQGESYTKAWRTLGAGMITMQTALGINDTASFYSKVKKKWIKYTADNVIKENFKIKYYGVKLLEVLRIIALIVFAFFLLSFIMYVSSGKSDPLAIPLTGGAFAVTLLLFISSIIIRTNMKKTVLSAIDEKLNSLTDSALIEFIPKCRMTYNYLMVNADLKRVCEKIGIDPLDYKVDLEKQSGGGNTYVGWGSLGAIGVGAGLSAISAAHAANENVKANVNLINLECLCYYNNVAFYFNEHIEEIEKTFATV
jgi:hypothetical protein